MNLLVFPEMLLLKALTTSSPVLSREKVVMVKVDEAMNGKLMAWYSATLRALSD